MDPEEFVIERLMLRIGNTINNIRIKDLKESDLTPAQSETILFYGRFPGSSIRELAGYLMVTHQAARKLVDKLRKKGILRSCVSEEDRRYTSIYLTDTGEDLCLQLKKGGTSTGKDITEGFSEQEKRELRDYLLRIENNLGR
ncbi:MAG: MarR family winged helix-turn-helix transcriptional regulator [Candidatus Weimeria sp.]